MMPGHDGPMAVANRVWRGAISISQGVTGRWNHETRELRENSGRGLSSPVGPKGSKARVRRRVGLRPPAVLLPRSLSAHSLVVLSSCSL